MFFLVTWIFSDGSLFVICTMTVCAALTSVGRRSLLFYPNYPLGSGLEFPLSVLSQQSHYFTEKAQTIPFSLFFSIHVL
jgi:hypothetical protein